MNLTLAMGLQYESQSGKINLPSAAEGASSASIKRASTQEAAFDHAKEVIDVQAIETPSYSTATSGQIIFDYLSYNLHAGLVLLPAIGTQLDLTA